MPDDRKLTVIYIAGWGRSGSTVIGSLLGQREGATYIGELNYLWDDAFVRDDHFCGCGKPYSECEFWPGVLDTCGIDQAAGRQLAELGRKRLSMRLSLLSSARLPKSFAHGPLAEYKDAAGRVLHEAAKRLGAGIIIDASKTPTLIELYAQLDVDVKILHLVRDPRAVAYSWYHRAKRRGPSDKSGLMMRHNPVRSTAAWLARNYLIEQSALRLGLPYQRLRYEDFVAAPEQTLSAILDGFGLSGQSASDHEVNPHSIRGNPVKFTRQPITIRSDDVWKREMPNMERWLVAAMAAPQLLRYQYAMGV